MYAPGEHSYEYSTARNEEIARREAASLREAYEKAYPADKEICLRRPDTQKLAGSIEWYRRHPDGVHTVKITVCTPRDGRWAVSTNTVASEPYAAVRERAPYADGRGDLSVLAEVLRAAGLVASA